MRGATRSPRKKYRPGREPLRRVASLEELSLPDGIDKGEAGRRDGRMGAEKT